MSRPPKIAVPGLNRGAGIPPGCILGRRRGAGHGPAELLNLVHLTAMGVAAGATVAQNDSSVVSTALSSTTSLSGAVSTVDSNQSISLSQVSSSLSGALSSTTSLSGALGTAAVKNIGTSGNTVPLLDGVNTWSSKQAHSVSPSTDWLHDYTGDTLTVANGANAALAAGSGKIMVCNPANGDVGEYNVGGAGVTFVGSTAGTWVGPTTTPGPGTASVTFNGTTSYNLYNNFGSSQAFIVALVAKVRASI